MLNILFATVVTSNCIMGCEIIPIRLAFETTDHLRPNGVFDYQLSQSVQPVR